MPTAVFTQPDQSEITIEAACGESVMRAAVRRNVEGILADCAGALTCSTCHVYVDAAWFDKLPAADCDELELLEFTAAARRPTSRLSCQIRMSDELDGLRMTVPECQL